MRFETGERVGLGASEHQVPCIGKKGSVSAIMGLELFNVPSMDEAEICPSLVLGELPHSSTLLDLWSPDLRV